MLKIVALNDEPTESDEQEEVVATREAQETIAESEYIRAIRLKADGKVDLALHILNELLETQVLNENITGNNNEKLWFIKYNCHKNIAMILEERQEFELALQHYVSAILIDNTDVYTLNKFGLVALKLNCVDLAEYAFENCLFRNASHWRASEGMLVSLYSNNNVLGTFRRALQMCRENPGESRAAQQMVQELATWFKKDSAVLGVCGGENAANELCIKPNFRLLFDSRKEYKEESPADEEEKPVERFKDIIITSLSWSSLGRFILDVYTLCRETNQSLFTCFNLEDYIDTGSNVGNESPLIKPVADEDKFSGTTAEAEPLETIGEKSPADIESAQPMDCNNEDSDPSSKAAEGIGAETNKSKPRRRCSDLHFLEQWGWHKNRRYSSRKKAEREEPDDSLNSYLRRIFASHMSASTEGKWPFGEENKVVEASSFQCDMCKISSEGQRFQAETRENFDKFLKKLKGGKKDLMVLIYKWLKYVSLDWSQAMPSGIKELYRDIFGLYMQHFDLKTWNQLTANNYEASFRICLLYLELTAAEASLCSSDMWQQVFHHVSFSIGLCSLIASSNNDVYELRLLYLKYLKFNEGGEYQDCLGCLEVMSQILGTQADTFILHLPNSGAVCVTTKFIESMQRQYRTQIDINSIPQLYEAQSWNSLIKIIINNMETGCNMYENEKWFKDFRIEIEILLQSLWKMDSFNLCLSWSEKCLHYAVSHYLEETKSAYRQKLLADLINFIISYIEAIILNEGHTCINCIKSDSLSRLVQNLIRILVYQFDGTYEKNSTHGLELDFKRPWVILHQLVLSTENNYTAKQNSTTEENEDIYELVPNSFSILFTAHEYLGKRQWCSNDNGEILQYILDNVVFNLKAPIYDNCRDIIYEYLEQVTYCLFKYPQKKARSRHLEDHEATPVHLTWPKSIQIFDLYQPEHLPEFNSYKLESITSDMEQLLLKIIALNPKELEPSEFTHHVTRYIEGEDDKPPDETKAFKLPYKIVNLYYLLGDFYFKSRDFVKAIKFYTLDLTANPKRFDSWAGLALSKASKIDTKLNGIDAVSTEQLWEESEQVLRCFECCITLNRFQTLLWIEYGSFCYTIHSYYSRYLKYNSSKLEAQILNSLEERRNKTLNVAYNCFSLVNSIQNSTPTNTNMSDDSSDTNDEKWLCQYMLGKISEKRKEEPNVYLNHYLMAANFLYECNATYPIKINHSNPTTLSVEALEIFYRINAAIIKFIGDKETISRNTGDLLKKVLRNLSNSPFAYNKAKVHGNSLNMMKRKQAVQKPKQTVNTNVTAPEAEGVQAESSKTKESEKSPLQMETTTATAQESPEPSTVVSSATSSAMSTETSSMESESESNDSAATNVIKNNSPLSLEELKPIYAMVIQNIEECATRFPEHYKSIYRLIYHYMNSPPAYCNLETCEQLLMGQYKTTLGNVINGIFYERKNNNLFNGIWRIPSSEVDRPGSFSSHLIKCVNIFIKLLAKTNNHKILIDIATNLYKNPDADKRYIADSARKELYQQCISYTVKILKDTLEKNMQQRDDMDVLNLMIEIYKIHKKCVKYMNQKEATFTKLLVEAYKFFIKDKVEQIPENCNFLDLAIKLCSQEVTSRKLNEKSNNFEGFTSTTDWLTMDTHTRLFNQFRTNTNATKPTTVTSNPVLSAEKPETSKTPQLPQTDSQPPTAPLPPPSLNLFTGDQNKSLESNVQELQQKLKEYYINLLGGHGSLNLNVNDMAAKAPNLSQWLPTPTTAATSALLAENIINPKPIQVKPKSSAKRKKSATPYQRPAAANYSLSKGMDNLPQDLYNKHENPLLHAYIQGNVTGNASPPVNLSQKSIQESINPRSFLMEHLMNMGKNSGTTTAMENTAKTMGHTAAYQSLTGSGINSLGRHPAYNSLNNIGVGGQQQQQPTKTLQEKLAERQKTGQMKELDSSSSLAANEASARSGNKSSDDDVIILE